jgi:hypothetical protein
VFNEARLPAVWRFLVRTFGLHGTQALTILIVLGFGYVAHQFKLRNKLYYGYLEILFGVVSATMVVTRVNFAAVEFTDLTLSQMVALIGAAYVVARGLTNCHEARAALANIKTP